MTDIIKADDATEAPADDKKAQIIAALKQLMALISGEQAMDDPDEDEEKPEDPPEQNKNAPVEAIRSEVPELEASPDKPKAEKARKISITNFAQEGALQALNDKIEAQQKQLDAMAQEKRVTTYSASLLQAGYSAGSIQKYKAVVKDHGEVAGQQYGEGLKQNGPSDPPRNWNGEVRSEQPDSKAVQSYAARGPELLDQARSLAASYAKTNPDMSIEDYIAANMNPGEFLTNARKRA